jgi:hypothetical protein
MADTQFKLPTSPQGFSVPLNPSTLRNIDFSGLDYTTARRAVLEYINTYYPTEFNDFVASNGIMMLADVIAAVVGKLSLRSDLLAGEATLPTATTEEAVVNHLALINQRMKRQTAATVDIECTVDVPINADINIPAGTLFSFTGNDGKRTFYQAYRAPADYTSDIIIPAGKRGVIVWGLEGRDAAPVRVVSNGDANQSFTVENGNVLESPIRIEVVYNNVVENWVPIFDPIEKYGPNDRVCEVVFYENNMICRFGDGITGAIPKNGAQITIYTREGGGIRGRIGVGVIDTIFQVVPQKLVTTPITVRCRNITPSSGGTDKETISQAKRRAPREYAMHGSIISADDYASAAQMFSHPAYGTISKAIATVRTAYENPNLVEIYALAAGPDNVPILPSVGLKQGLKTYIKGRNCMTDEVNVLDGVLRYIDVDMVVVVSRNADASVVKEKVESALDTFFDPDNWQLGQPLYISNLIQKIESIDGVTYVDLFSPSENILQTGKLADPANNGIGINEIIVEGTRKTSYYYERSTATGSRT